ncbi:MAG TPA: hypothetical protein VF150_04990, partial [Thermoanaerobaculia bacterium]
MPPCRRLVSALLAAVLAAAVPASATTYVMVEDPVLADQAAAVVDARVVSVEPAPVAGRPATDYTVEIERLVAGSAPGTTLIVRVPGGVRPDGVELHLHGMPRFAVGERALLFLVPRNDGTFGILHLGLGAFHRVAAAGAPPLALRDLSDAQEVVLPGSKPSPDAGRARDYDAFAGWLADRGAGIERPADYFTETPPAALPRLAERFSLLGGGGLHVRWFEFDSGGSVPWQAHSAGQAGLPGGGFNEFKAALQAWNGESRTPVKLTFAGQTGASQGFEDFDGVNTLLQGDPNHEIDGKFRCGSGGGILAIGGPWTDPDRRGTFRGEEYLRAVGADIIMNDGVECQEIFNRCYAELIAVIYTHELGHTLGLGHSCGDSRSPSCAESSHLAEATMRASAQSDCRGAAIRPDDAAGLRRLYEPPGGGRPRGPAAPGDLAGDLRKAFVELRWKDNSEDEEGFRIYRSADGGDFEPLATVGPDVTVFFDDSIAPATAYRYRVAAFNAQGESGQSEPVAVPVPPVTPVTVDLALAQPEEFRVGEPVELRASFSGPAEIAEWDFGGGAVGFNDTPCLPGAFCRSHVFTAPGPRTVEVTVVGDFGQVAHDTLEIVVADAPFETVAAESFFQSVIFGQRGNTGTFESNVWLHNAGPRAALLELSYLPRGLEAPPAPRTLTLAPAESIFLPNVLEKVFGVSAGQGSLALTARHADQGDGPPRVFAASRSFVELANRAQGSFGQLVPQQDESSWTDADKVVTGILQGDGFLSTLLAVNVDDHGGRVDVELTDRNGDPVGDPVPFALGPGVMRFRPTGDVFPGFEEREGPFTARFRSNGIRFLASSTLLETGSEDQIFLPAREPAGAAEILLPRVVRSPGQFGVFLTTRASVLNTSSVPTDLTFQLLLRGQNNSAPLEATRTVPPGGVLFLEDVIRDLFDLETATGALQVLWDNAQGVAPQVVALTLSESPQGDRFGMAIEGRPVDQAVTSSGVGFGIEQSDLFRSQYGVVNLRDGRTDLLLTLRDGNGAVLGQTDLALKPRQHLELNLV